MRKKWLENSHKITALGKFPTLNDVVKMVEVEAEKRRDPVFGSLVDMSLVSSKSSIKAQAFIAESKVSESFSREGNLPAVVSKHCIRCSQDHWLDQCSVFVSDKYEERRKMVLSKGLCFKCLKPNHTAHECKFKRNCEVCGKRHHTLLHSYNSMPNENNSSTPPRAANGFVDTENVAIGLPIVPVKVKNPNGNNVVQTYALLDSGSNSTFCTEGLKKKLGIKGKKTQYTLTTLEKEATPVIGEIVSLQISDVDENHSMQLSTVLTRSKLPISLEDRATQEDISEWTHLQDIPFYFHKQDETIGLLIGNDNFEALRPKKVVSGGEGEPCAIQTVLGWTINGPLKRKGKTVTSNFIRKDSQLTQMFNKYTERDFEEVKGKEEMSREDIKALGIFKTSVKYEDGHYCVDLPWREEKPLDNNIDMARRRLLLLKKRLDKDPELKVNYVGAMKENLKKGYAEKVMTNKDQPQAWYLPHFPVFNPAKPEKTRIVFDCASKFKGRSLNDCLLQGPDLTSSLFGVLTRFRKNEVAVMGDIKEMFHQVRVSPAHCDYLRFLWWDTEDFNEEPGIYRMKVHLFGATSSPSVCSYALQKAAEDNEKEFGNEIAQSVKENFYVDDCLKSLHTEEEAIHFVTKVTQLLDKGGFKITKWISNSSKVLESIPESDRNPKVKDLDLEKLPIEKALGVLWDTEKDSFGFKVKVKEKPATRRGILSIISSVYDPLGFTAPCMLQAKILLQDLARAKLDWDEEISEQNFRIWQRWLSEVHKLAKFSSPRCLKPCKFGLVESCQLHHFSDASQVGYGAVSYARLMNYDKEVSVVFLVGKSRVTPLKTVTVPRLELAAATVSVKLDQMIRKEIDLPIEKSVFWTDSMAVLRYIHNEDKRFHTYVANRVTMIRENTDLCNWKHVSSDINPADHASRGLTANQLIHENTWIAGPAFLSKFEDEWPAQAVYEGQLDSDDPEVKRKVSTCAQTAEKTGFLHNLIQKYSSWTKTVRVVAWILRFITRLKGAQSKERYLSVDEVDEAEMIIIKTVQKSCFPEEFKSLSEGQGGQIKKSSSLYKLKPMMFNGLLCVGGRLVHAGIPEKMKHPVILPKKHHVTHLIIQHYHQACGHSGRDYVLSQLRSRYWIIKANSTVRHVLHSCHDCKRRQASPCVQQMSDLPEERVKPDKPPFTYVGIDYFGPFHIKRARSMVKYYGCIFTCLTSKAVHIEVSSALDTDAFINALRRFIARRGAPELIRSDNGTNFVAGERELRESILSWNQEAVNDFLVQKHVKWVFNPPAASHWGGVWERCIRSIRKVLSAVLKLQTLDVEGLMTFMTEVESILNGRPITTVSDDPNDLEPLTPNHLLLLRSVNNLPPGVFRKEDLYVRRRWRQVQYMADQFWKRWISEYLPLLQTRQKWIKPERNIHVDDVVLLVDDVLPRGNWPLARVVNIFPGDDGLVRKVRVRTQNSMLVRPVTKCVFLEGQNED
ncbi:uncharacterized protein LOC106160350 [Lingula anatina]|uniref:Uncharacterized protein LOC106160350 n=1 Tax=Lingula anatina TaxID=7574 RepID=A0A1S3I2B0_LINAN|nr:uncharacterized protein LOC106160350 [Lingula anatina]|eukprot:XP_013392383.1 uncharacterized protein LOC106160350 [Lingula anatina]